MVSISGGAAAGSGEVAWSALVHGPALGVIDPGVVSSPRIGVDACALVVCGCEYGGDQSGHAGDSEERVVSKSVNSSA